MARLPQPGSDDGVWGGILNDYLSVSLDTDGTLKTTAVPDATAAAKGKIQLDGDLGGTAASPVVQKLQGTALNAGAPSDGQSLVYNQAAGQWEPATVTASGSVPDATTTSKGVVQLAGDLGGPGTTAAAPVISSGAITGTKIAAGAITDANISATAAISKSKLASLAIADADVSAISESKITNLTTDLSAKVDKSKLNTVVVAASNSHANSATYTCDGTADQVEIQAALNSLASTGGRVELLEGTYNISATISIPYAGANKSIELVGAGWATRLVAASGLNDYIITLDGTTTSGAGFLGYRVAHLFIDGNCTAQTAGGGIKAAGAINSHFEDLHITAPYDTGLWLYQIGAGSFGHHNRVSSCLFDGGTASAGNGRGIVLQSCDENFITNCDFENLGGAGSEPYAIKDWAGTNKIDNCVFVNNGEAVRLQDVSSSNITASTFDGGQRNHITVSGSKHVITGNNFAQGQQSAAGTYSCIEFQSSASYNIVSSNAFISHTTNGQTKAFVSEGSGGDHNQVINNSFQIQGTLSAGLYSVSGANTVFRHNQGDTAVTNDHYRITVSATAPVSPQNGDIWFDTSGS